MTLPLSALELQDAVRTAKGYDPARLDRVLRLEMERDQIEVQASTSWASLAARVAPEGLRESLAACPLTVGESVAVNAPGPDGIPLVAHVESIAMVMPEGELRRVNRHRTPKLFALAVGGQGLFGVTYSVTLRVESLLRAARHRAPTAALDLASTTRPVRALELLLPPAEAERFLADARGLCAEWRLALSAASVRQTIAEDETILRWARRDYAAVTLLLEQLPTLGGTVRTTQVRRSLIDAAIARGGSYSVSSTPEATREHVETCYPEIRSMLAEKRRLDPEEKVASAWYRHHRSLLGRETCSVRWNH